MKTIWRANSFALSLVKLTSSLSLLFLGLLLTGCPAGKSSSDPAGGQTGKAAGSENKVVIRGSNTIGEELAPRLIAEFKKDHPGHRL